MPATDLWPTLLPLSLVAHWCNHQQLSLCARTDCVIMTHTEEFAYTEMMEEKAEWEKATERAQTVLGERTMTVKVPGHSHQLRWHVHKQAVIMAILSLLDRDGSNRKNGGPMCKMTMKSAGSWRHPVCDTEPFPCANKQLHYRALMIWGKEHTEN